jgi:hypothetical protein
LEARGKGIAGVSIAASWPLHGRWGDGRIFAGDRRKGQNFADLNVIVHRLSDCRLSGRSASGDPIDFRKQWPSFRHFREAIMNEDALNVSVRKFLKEVGITSQREIEQAVRAAVAAGRLKGNEAVPAKMMLTVDRIGLSLEIDGAIELE